MSVAVWIPCSTLSLTLFLTLSSLINELQATKVMNRADTGFWVPISLTDFDERTGHVYPLAPSDDIAIEHWIERNGVLLGVVVLNCVDSDYGYLVLGRDEHNQFRAIEVACSHLSSRRPLGAAFGDARDLGEARPCFRKTACDPPAKRRAFWRGKPRRADFWSATWSRRRWRRCWRPVLLRLLRRLQPRDGRTWS